MLTPIIDLSGDAEASWAVEGFSVVTTEQLAELLAQGYVIELPDVDPSVLELGYDVDASSLSGSDNPIVSVEEVGEEEVQCISVDDADHLYLTDGLIPTHNTANIVFLKSTDDSMLETLEKMSGKTHQTYTDSKMVTRNEERMVLKNEGTVSYTRSTVEEPVISYNDLAFLPERNSIMFLASHPCVWNRNETILPMSWRLYGSHTISQPGHDYTLQTIPTLSSAMDFDARQNQPDFEQMLERRLEQARHVQQAMDDYKKAYGYSDYDVSRLDEDVYSDAIMDIVDERVQMAHGSTTKEETDAALAAQARKSGCDSEVNTEVKSAVMQRESENEAWSRPRYAGGRFSRATFKGIGSTDAYNHQYDAALIRAAVDIIGFDALVNNSGGRLQVSPDGQALLGNKGERYIYRSTTEHADAQAAARGVTNPHERVMADTESQYVTSDELEAAYGSYRITNAFYDFLLSFDGDWNFGSADNTYGKAVRNVVDRVQ